MSCGSIWEVKRDANKGNEMTTTFDLDYLVDNGRLTGWVTDWERGCTIVQWQDDRTFTVRDGSGKPLGWGETAEDAWQDARINLTVRRRERDGITPARVA